MRARLVWSALLWCGLLGTLSLTGSPEARRLTGLVREENAERLDHEPFHRWGPQAFKLGVAFQAVALLIQFLMIVKDVGKDLCFTKGNCARIVANPDVLNFTFTLLSFYVLDGMYEANFAGDALSVYRVETSVTHGSHGTTADASTRFVVASSSEGALSPGCYSFTSAFSPECKASLGQTLHRVGHAVKRVALTNSTAEEVHCSLDAGFVTGALFGPGWAQLWPSMFVFGTFIIFAVNARDFLTTFVPPFNREIAGENKSIYAKHVDALIGVAFDGLAQGFMLMTLTVEVNDDCANVNTLLPFESTHWFASGFAATFMVVSLVISLDPPYCTVGKFGCKPEHDKVGTVSVLILATMALLTFGYTVCLSAHLARSDPGNSSHVLGTVCACLGILSNIGNIFDDDGGTKDRYGALKDGDDLP